MKNMRLGIFLMILWVGFATPLYSDESSHGPGPKASEKSRPQGISEDAETRKAMRTIEQVGEGLISAEVCLAAIAAIATIAKSPQATEKVFLLLEKLDHKAVSAVATRTGLGAGKSWGLVKGLEVGPGSAVLKTLQHIALFVIEKCHRGGIEVVEALKDLPGAAGEVISGPDQSAVKRLETNLSPNDPKRVSRSCWDNATRGLFCGKRCEALKCCDSTFNSNPNDRLACRNNVNTIGNISGW